MLHIFGEETLGGGQEGNGDWLEGRQKMMVVWNLGDIVMEVVRSDLIAFGVYNKGEAEQDLLMDWVLGLKKWAAMERTQGF